MATIRLQIAYEGTAYHGWQIQSKDRSVEGELTRALMKILNAEEPVKVQGASRTDAGVHSLGQVAHFHHDTDRRLWDFSRGLNALTDEDICVMRVEEVAENFHARHCARGKIYRYQIWNHRFPHPFLRRRSWRVPLVLDVEKMAKAAADFVGTHDFSGFRAADCSSLTTERTMRRVEVSQKGPNIEILVEGDAFLKHMVRAMVGTLVDIGHGRFGVDQVRRALISRDRCDAGQTAPSAGLTLEKVFYPDFPWRGPEPELGGPYLIQVRDFAEAAEG